LSLTARSAAARRRYLEENLAAVDCKLTEGDLARLDTAGPTQGERYADMSRIVSLLSERRTVVITGAASGIGQACARRLAGPAAQIVALDRDPEGLASTVADVQGDGGTATSSVMDVTDTEQIRAVISAIPRIDVLVNCAGAFSLQRLEEVTDDDFRSLYEVNVIGLFAVTQAALARMPDGAAIVNLGSRAYLGSRDHVPYVASKAAVTGLTRTLALELRERRIAVNAVAPGMVRTPMVSGLGEEILDRAARNYPGGRLPEPEDVAHAVAFFADPATRFVTGQILLLDGGRSVGLSNS
jgi:3-oxoacyl-[acyl-carrier protein] reductase